MKTAQEGYKAYPKIHRLGKDETLGMLKHPVTVQEKVDGANISIFILDGEVRCGTRTRMLPKDESFNGFQEAVMANEKLVEWLQERPDVILYGEWLVKHTITYPDAAYRKIYLYDIYLPEEDRWYHQDRVSVIAQSLDLAYPHVFMEEGIWELDEIQRHVGTSAIGPLGEGVVVKSTEFVNQFGEHCYGKIVTEKFKESNAIVFGGNNKSSATYWEMYVVNKYCTVGRVEKIMQKAQSVLEEKLDKKHTAQITGRCYYDLITEEAWEISQKVVSIDFKALQRLCNKKFTQIFHDILDNSFSVADL